MGELRLVIPWTNFKLNGGVLTEPIVIEISRIYALAAPNVGGVSIYYIEERSQIPFLTVFFNLY